MSELCLSHSQGARQSSVQPTPKLRRLIHNANPEAQGACSLGVPPEIGPLRLTRPGLGWAAWAARKFADSVCGNLLRWHPATDPCRGVIRLRIRSG
jgi:hypothetical protein